MQRSISIHPWQWAMALCAFASALSTHLEFFTEYAIFNSLTMVLALTVVRQLAEGQRHP